MIARHSDSVDAAALAVILLGSVVNYRRGDWTFGGPALDVDEERFIAAWVRAAYDAITCNAEEQK